MDSCPPDCRNESSSTQSTGQSHHEVSNMSGDHFNRQCVSAQSDITYGKQGDAQNKSILSLGTPEFVFPRQVDYARSVAHLPYPYIDPYYSGIVTSYGPQAILSVSLSSTVHPNISAVIDELASIHKLIQKNNFRKKYTKQLTHIDRYQKTQIK
ncbi:hypothetical protein MKX01_016105 [Papaver californicum]|nr:hypothetical protein MKX01_016105 [Papaver californicum]